MDSCDRTMEENWDCCEPSFEVQKKGRSISTTSRRAISDRKGWWALPSSGGTVVFARDARDAFDSLTEALVKECPGLDRGIAFRRIRREIFEMIESHIGSDPALLRSNDVTGLVAQLGKWFEHVTEPREVFVPCAISPWPAPQFTIGPMRFTHMDDVP